jgi:predicted RNA-binding protein with PUA-like domain
MPYWLMKSEPDELSIEALQHMERARWDGVRNYQARNYLRAMKPGDLFFFYHSSCPQPGIAGIGKILTASYPDPTALESDSHYFDINSTSANNRWSAVDVGFVDAFPAVIPLSHLKALPQLAELALVKKGSRLSVMPVSPVAWQSILTLA